MNNQKYFHPLNLIIVIQIASTVLVISLFICTNKRSLSFSSKKEKRKKREEEKVLSQSILQSLQSLKERSIPSRSKVR
jgi:ATP/ADP translocase